MDIQEQKLINETAKIVRNWYDFGRESIPQIEDLKFGYFAGEATSLTRAIIVENGYDYIIDMKAPTAYIENESQTIALPGWYFSKAAIKKLFELSEEVDIDFEAISLALCNGSSLHETLHLAHTPKVALEKLAEDAVKYLPLEVMKGYEAIVSSKQVTTTIVNISEDLRIEGYPVSINAEMTKIQKFIECKNKILFQLAAFEKACKALEDAATDNERLTARINIAIMMKNKDLRKVASTLAVDETKQILRAVNEISNWDSGFGKSFVLLFMAIVDGLHVDEVDSKEGGSEKSATGGGDEGDDSEESEGESSTETSESPSSEGKSEASESEKAAFKAMTEEDEEALKAIEQLGKAFAKASEEEKEEFVAEKAAEGKAPFSNFKPVYEDDIMSLVRRYDGDDYKRLDDSQDWSFVSLLKQLRSKNFTPGELKRTGSQMTKTHLNRIVTDGKIFSNKTFEKHVAHEVEVAILVDYSGSMDTIIKKVVSTTFGFFNALKKVGIKVDAYGHTSSKRSQSEPMLFKICAGGISGNHGNAYERFAKSLNIRLVQNYDSVIIQKLASFCFKNKSADARKIIFVLSDGSPAGIDYGGSKAVEHTKQVVQKIRESGVLVIAISLVSGVVEQNNAIYGKQFNVDASEDLKKSFSELVVRLQKENSL